MSYGLLYPKNLLFVTSVLGCMRTGAHCVRSAATCKRPTQGGMASNLTDSQLQDQQVVIEV